MFYDEHTNMTELELRALADSAGRCRKLMQCVVIDEFVHTIRAARKVKCLGRYRHEDMQVGNYRTRTLKRYRCPKRC